MIFFTTTRGFIIQSMSIICCCCFFLLQSGLLAMAEQPEDDKLKAHQTIENEMLKVPEEGKMTVSAKVWLAVLLFGGIPLIAAIVAVVVYFTMCRKSGDDHGEGLTTTTDAETTADEEEGEEMEGKEGTDLGQEPAGEEGMEVGPPDAWQQQQEMPPQDGLGMMGGGMSQGGGGLGSQQSEDYEQI